MEVLVNYNMLIEQLNIITSNPYGNLAANVFVLAVAMYIVWYLYRKIAKRNMFEFNGKDYGKGLSGAIKKTFSIIIYIIKYGILFPLYSFVMFVLLSVSIFFLSTGLSIGNILYTSIIIISVVRLLAYIKEDAAQELSKMLPFALILLVLTNPNVAQQYTLPDIGEIINSLSSLEQYVVFLIGLEIGLRLLYFVLTIVFSKEKEKNN